MSSCVLGVQLAPAPAQVSRRNKPGAPEGARLVAADWNVTKRPVALIEVAILAPLACVPSEATETRTVDVLQPVGAPAQVSRTKTSATPFVSLSTRFMAEETKVT